MPKIFIKHPARIAGDVYDVADIIGKTLFPRVTIDYYSNVPGRGGAKLGIIKAGYPAGTVISWVQDPVSKTIWWQFIDSKGYYYIEHQSGRFNVSSLKQQGVLTVAEKIEEEKKKEEEENKPWYQTMGEGLNSTVKTGLWILGGAIVFSSLLKR